MARLLAVVVPLVLLLALAPGASAASRTVSVDLPRDGDLSLAQYRVKVGGPGAPKTAVTNRRRLGDADVIVVTDRLKRRTYLVTVIALNPGGGASAAQAGAAKVSVKGVGDLTVTELETVQEVLLDDANLGDENAILDFCASKAARRAVHTALVARGLTRAKAVRILRALVTYLCQRGTTQQILDAEQTLDELGILAPECSGTVDEFEGRLDEIVLLIQCGSPVDVIVVQAQQGNTGTACLGPPGSFCQAGPGCAPLPPDTVCFFHPGGFPAGTQMPFNARFAMPVPAGDEGPSVDGRSFDASSNEPNPMYFFQRVHN